MANDINSITVTGYVVSDPTSKEFSKPEGSNYVTNFRVSVNRSYKKGDSWQDEKTYLNVAFWGRKPLEVEKGDTVFVTGSLKEETWEKDGQKHSKYVLVADTCRNFKFVKKEAPTAGAMPF